jgi:hypothetical protein
VAGCEHRVGPHDEVENVREAVWGVDAPPPARFEAHPEAGGGRFEGVDRRLGGFMRWAWDAELLLVPQVDAAWLRIWTGAGRPAKASRPVRMIVSSAFQDRLGG